MPVRTLDHAIAAPPGLDRRRQRFASLAWITAVCSYFLVVFGGIVRITGSGLGCGDDWPLCRGVPRDQAGGAGEPDLRCDSGHSGGRDGLASSPEQHASPSPHRHLIVGAALWMTLVLWAARARQHASQLDLRPGR